MPNLFTLGSLFCALYSMLIVSEATSGRGYWAAGWMIGLATVLDGVDGRVARLTKTQSKLGLELDSLVDNVAFGVAPAWLVYHWGLSQFTQPFGFLIAFVFAAAVTLRLARFNVISKDNVGDPRFFVGLASPCGAGVMASLIGVHGQTGAFGVPASGQLWVALITLFVAFLMVCNIRFHSMKSLGLRRPRNRILLAMAVIAFIYVSAVTTVETGILAGFSTYITFHLAAALVHLERRVLGRKAAVAEVEEMGLGIDEADDDDEEEAEDEEIAPI